MHAMQVGALASTGYLATSIPYFLTHISPANHHVFREPTSGLEPLTCSLRVSLSPTLDPRKYADLQVNLWCSCPSHYVKYRPVLSLLLPLLRPQRVNVTKRFGTEMIALVRRNAGHQSGMYLCRSACPCGSPGRGSDTSDARKSSREPR
jgi:hypothetical protein